MTQFRRFVNSALLVLILFIQQNCSIITLIFPTLIIKYHLMPGYLERFLPVCASTMWAFDALAVKILPHLVFKTWSCIFVTFFIHKLPFLHTSVSLSICFISQSCSSQLLQSRSEPGRCRWKYIPSGLRPLMTPRRTSRPNERSASFYSELVFGQHVCSGLMMQTWTNLLVPLW